VLHHPDSEWRPLVRDRGAQYQLDRRVVQNFALASGRFRLRKPFQERGRQIGLLREHGHQLTAATLHRLDLAVDVGVVDADDGKSESRRTRAGLLPGHGHDRSAGEGHDRRGSRHAVQEFPASNTWLLHRQSPWTGSPAGAPSLTSQLARFAAHVV
jgi:hypothetical protein